MAASLSVALMAGFTGLSLLQGASDLSVSRRKGLVALSAVILGGGIWSMHFVAMLGLQLPILFYYDALITLISALVAILIVGLALLLLHFRERSPITITTAGALIGAGIVVMHYVGMSAMELCRPVYSIWVVAEATAVSIALSVAAIWVAYGVRTHRNVLVGTVCFALAVFAMHFFAMWRTGFLPMDAASAVGPALSNEVLAIIVAVITFMICGASLLSGATFLPPRDAQPDIKPDNAQPTDTTDPEHTPPRPVPFEREGRTLFADQATIAAIRAEGRYTILYVGAEKLFCPWSISDAEARLAPGLFLRTHRSYLINPAHVTGFERSKDSGAVTFDRTDSLTKVPVSRSRLGAVRGALGL